MADWNRPLDDLMDGLTLPQFRLLTKMRLRRIAEERRWDLQIASFTIQTKEQSEAWADMMDGLRELDDGVPSKASMGGEGTFTVSTRHPLLHELTEAQVAGDRRLRKLIKFRKVTEPESGVT